MRVALIQNNPVFGDKKGNIDRLQRAMDSTPADLYVLPELCYSGYQFTSMEEAIELADSQDSGYLDIFRSAARRLDACIVFGFPERQGDKLYNASLAVLPDGTERLYRKTHLFYKETIYFQPGNLGFQIIDFRETRIGMAICFDWFFPESFRTLAMMGADIIAHCSNLVLPYCQQANFAQAVHNRVYIATANRVGTEKREEESLTFTGGSVLVSPKGEYLITGPSEEPAILVSDIDTGLARNKRLNEFNDIFKDRKPGFYGYWYEPCKKPNFQQDA
jgi:predicted amidohydrolase